MGEEAVGYSGDIREAALLTVPQESKLSLWGGRVRCEKPHEKNPHPGFHVGKISAWGCKGGGRPGPLPATAFMDFILQPQAQEHGCGRGEWLQSDLTNWVEEWGGEAVREG